MISEDRLEKIETKLAFLEDFVKTLQEATLMGNREMEKIAAEQSSLREKLLQLSHDLEDIPDRKPPHY